MTESLLDVAPADRLPADRTSGLDTWRRGEQGLQRHLLLLRFTVLNLVAAALLAAAWMKGWIDLVVAADGTRLVAVIAFVFLYGLFDCAWKVLQTSRELDQIVRTRGTSERTRHYVTALQGESADGRALQASALKLSLAARIAPIKHIANSLVFLGLIGTVIGFIIALSAVDAGAAANVEAIGPMVSTLIGGMSIALYTTLVGAILNIWLMVNYRLLESGTVRLLGAIVEAGERHA